MAGAHPPSPTTNPPTLPTQPTQPSHLRHKIQGCQTFLGRCVILELWRRICVFALGIHPVKYEFQLLVGLAMAASNASDEESVQCAGPAGRQRDGLRATLEKSPQLYTSGSVVERWRARLVLVVGGGTWDQQVEPAPAPPLLGKAKPSEPSSCAAEKEKLAKCSTSREVEPSVSSLRSLVVFLKSIRSTDVLRNINRTLVIA